MGIERVPKELREMFRHIPAATATDAMAALGFRSTFMRGIRSLLPGHTVVGSAITVRFVPMREDLSRPADLSPMPDFQAVESVEPGDVVVYDASWSVGAVIGDVILTRLKVRGVGGIVTDGDVRDLPAMKGMGIPIFARGTDPYSGGHTLYPVDFNIPIQCGGVAVFPGDLILGDDDGIMVIPRGRAKEVYSLAGEKEDLEAYIRHKLITEGATLAKFYPPKKEHAEAAAKYKAGLQRR